MIKKISFLLCLIFSLLPFSAIANDLTIYTYSSFNSEWGPGPKVFPLFEKKCSCKLKIVTLEDTGQLLARFLLEQKSSKNKLSKTDILLGLNDTHLARVKSLDLFASYQGKLYSKLEKKFQLDKKKRFIPFDYGHLAFIYDSEKIKTPPRSLKDLSHPRFRKKIVIESPISSAPGLSFLHWTILQFGEKGFADYWQKLSPNLITITSGWSAAYGMFTKGEAPIVLSYVTSPAYHKIVEGEKKYRAAIFREGHYPQVEFAAIVKKSKKQKLANKFIDFMLGEDFQKAIPTSNWMYPVITYEKLPSAFDKQPKTLPLLDEKLIAKKQREWFRKWKSAIR